MLLYEDWNRRIVDHFFNAAKRSRRVRLSIDNDTLLGLGGERDDLVIATLSEAENHGSSNIQEFGLLLHERWRRKLDDTDEDTPVEPPPFVAVLALYVLAVNHGEDEWVAHQYYDRLHDLLGAAAGRIDTIEPSLVLWEALQFWANHGTRGRLGRFRVASVGGMRHIGIPKRQILLATREHESLERALMSAGVIPGSDPTDRRLLTAAMAADGLLARTRKLLAEWPASEPARDLLAEVREHLDDWDVVDLVEHESESRLELPLQLFVKTSGQDIVEASFGTELVADVTDTDRRLSMTEGPPGFKGRVRSFELITGSSETPQPIVVHASGDPTWMVGSCWFDAIEFNFDDLAVSLSRSKTRYIVMGQGPRTGMLVEVPAIEVRAGSSYLILAPSPSTTDPPPMVAEFLAEWRPCALGNGVWHAVFRAASLVRAAPELPSIRFSGGIPSGRGRGAFLHFGLPEAVVEQTGSGALVDVRLRALDDRGNSVTGRLGPRGPGSSPRRGETLWEGIEEQTTRFDIVDVSPACAHCEVEVIVDGAVVASRGFFVDTEPLSNDFETPVARDGLGLPATDSKPAIFQGLSCTGEFDGTAPSLPLASRLLAAEKELIPDTTALRVMQLMRTRHRISWREAKRLLPGCLAHGVSVHADARYLVHQIKILDALGILEVEENHEGGLSSIVELPPEIVLLPRLANRGFDDRLGPYSSHQAVLAGCWLPAQMEGLKRAAKPRFGVELHTAPRGPGAAFAPHFRSLLATGEKAIDRIRTVADKLEVAFSACPLAIQMARSMWRIDGLSDLSKWTPGKPADTFETRFFNPRSLGVSDRLPPDGDRYVLWECRHPDRPVWRFFIVDNEAARRLEVGDRQIARWFVRRHAVPDGVLPGSQGDVLVPLELRLPPILERMIALSSGRPPEFKRYERAYLSPFRDPDTSRKFAIPAPPAEPVDWLGSRDTCTGNFCVYRGAYGTAAWPSHTPLPMIGVGVERVTELGLEDVPL